MHPFVSRANTLQNFSFLSVTVSQIFSTRHQTEKIASYIRWKAIFNLCKIKSNIHECTSFKWKKTLFSLYFNLIRLLKSNQTIISEVMSCTYVLAIRRRELCRILLELANKSVSISFSQHTWVSLSLEKEFIGVFG